MENGKNKQGTRFEDLRVYQRAYKSMFVVIKQIIPKLPADERFDLSDQLRRSSKAIPRLIAEGYAKRHQKAGFQKYLDDAMAECNETIVSLNQAKDLYLEMNDKKLCDDLIEVYNIVIRELYKLRFVWKSFN